ncbi:MAG: hypothetical protein HY918_05330 [Candidatus Doudnabacteria bacterium]|nr:hypothetical protein [Candidatus Doudnabacteria bacterium]
MKLEFYNCPKPEEMPSVGNLSPSLSLPTGQAGSKGEGALVLPEAPEFVKYVPDFAQMEKLAQEYKDIKNILVIGHGGSITSFYGIYGALKEYATKKAYFLSTVDADYIYELKKTLSPQDTLVIAISKSGETMTQIEMLAQFLEFPLLFITGKSSPLRAMADKLKAKIIMHPPIGGRYTAMTEVGLLPAAIVGLDVKNLYEGAKLFYYRYDKDNLAFKAASVLYKLEAQGYVDVFMPFYTSRVFPLSNVIVQLCHESFGKNGKGQTYFAHEAPESQHHTNQRFFGGIKNICGFFTSVDNFDHKLVSVFPPQLHSVQLKGHALFDVNKIPLQAAMEYELLGTMEDARIQGIPMLHMSLASVTPFEIGGLLAFWQLYAVYASVLRGVDPFDQPQVESSKKISFNKRLAFKGLL